MPKLIQKFNAAHKNIVVKDVPMQWADISAKMPLAIKAGKGPDVSVAHGDDLATYAAQGLLLKSDSIVKTLGYRRERLPGRRSSTPATTRARSTRSRGASPRSACT